MLKIRIFFFMAAILGFVCFISSCQAVEQLFSLRTLLERAEPGDYIVVAYNQQDTVLWVQEKTAHLLTFEEISVPATQFPPEIATWKEWLLEGAPHHTSWVKYQVNTQTGEMQNFYSLMHHRYCPVSSENNLLSSLLNLQFKKIPDFERRRLGARERTGQVDRQKLWSPRLVLDGNIVDGVPFDAWRARWPKDGTDLADKVVEIYLPVENSQYPSYFPYWMQVSGLVGKAKMRVVDSGKRLFVPKG